MLWKPTPRSHLLPSHLRLTEGSYSSSLELSIGGQLPLAGIRIPGTSSIGQRSEGSDSPGHSGGQTDSEDDHDLMAMQAAYNDSAGECMTG